MPEAVTAPAPASASASVPGSAQGPAFSPREFRDAMGQFATGVVVVSVEVDGVAHAMTANAFMSGSLEPPLVLVSIACKARMHERIAAAGRFGVSILARSQTATSNHFAGKPSPEHQPRLDRLLDVPVISGAGTRLVAATRDVHPCGDHTLFVGEVLALDGPGEKPRPLLFHAGRYSELAAHAWSAEATPESFWLWQAANW